MKRHIYQNMLKKDNYIKKFINHTLFLGSSVIIQFVNKYLK